MKKMIMTLSIISLLTLSACTGAQKVEEEKAKTIQIVKEKDTQINELEAKVVVLEKEKVELVKKEAKLAKKVKAVQNVYKKLMAEKIKEIEKLQSK